MRTMRTLHPQHRQWLIERYGPEISAGQYFDLVLQQAEEQTVTKSNGVEVTRTVLADGRTVTRHSGLWETFYYVR